MNTWDLEAEMVNDHERAALADGARRRVEAFNALPLDEQHHRLRTRPDRDGMEAAQRVYRLHGKPGIHARLRRMENECVDLLLQADAERFRRTQ